MEDRSKRRARLILIVGFLFALIAAVGTFTLASGPQSAGTAAVPTTEVLVAAREIPQKTVLSATDLRLVRMNSDIVPASALRAEAQKDVVGKVNIYPISTGELIMISKFGGSADKIFTVFPPNLVLEAGQQIPPGTPNYRAYSITVQDQNAAGGAIQVGDVVDIMYTFQFDPAKYFTQQPGVLPGSPQDTRVSDFSVKIALERVPIIARTAAVYTIRTDAATAERLAYLNAVGASLQMLLRAPQDDRVVRSEGATFAPVYQEFRFRVPGRITP